uniref:Uncharacterized protein n=1 Tax=Physcomitrium patens TaxID=3218 RepID=A0A2K1J156_PHYPA|nr:hypothetical protein PHYPA_023160 [Physcomitrium patens]
MAVGVSGSNPVVSVIIVHDEAELDRHGVRFLDWSDLSVTTTATGCVWARNLTVCVSASSQPALLHPPILKGCY